MMKIINLLFQKRKFIIITFLLLAPILFLLLSRNFTNKFLTADINTLKVIVDSDSPMSRYKNGDFVQVNRESNSYSFLENFSDIVNVAELHLKSIPDSDQFEVYNPFKKDTIKYNLTFPSQEQQQYQIVYDQKASTLFFRKTPQEVNLNSQKISDGGINIYKIENISLGDTLKIADKYIMISKEGIIANISETYLQNQIEKLSVSNVNLLENQNESFQDGTWQNVVSDCEKNAEGDPKIEMNIEGTDKYLSLAAETHSACTYKDFELPIRPLKEMVFSIDYNNIEGNSGSVYLNFIDGREKQIYDEIGNPKYVKQQQESVDILLDSDKKWQTYSTVISNKLDNPFLLEVYLYSRAFQNTKERTLFDNLRLSEVNSTSIVNLEKIPDIAPLVEKPIELEQGKNVLKFDLDPKNIISSDNSSFEEGLWQTFPTDCSDYMPGFQAFESKISSDATNGKYSLNLKSKNHFACVFRKYSTSLSSNFVYKLSFDYKVLVGEKAQYYIKIVSKSDDNVSADFTDTIISKDKSWHTESIILDSYIKDIQYVEVYLYAPSTGLESSILYDNISIVSAYPRNFEKFIVSGAKQINQEETSNFLYTKVIGQTLDPSNINSENKLLINSNIDSLVKHEKTDLNFDKYFQNNLFTIKNILAIYFALAALITIYIISKKFEILTKYFLRLISKFSIPYSKITFILFVFIILVTGFFVNLLLAAIISLSSLVFFTKLPAGILSTLSFTSMILSGIFLLFGNFSLAEILSISSFLLIIAYSVIEIFSDF